MCTEDWKGTGSGNLVTMCTGACATSKLLCQGLSCRLFFGTLSEAWYSPESPHSTPGQPFHPELTMPFTSLWGGQGLGDFFLFTWFSLMKVSSCKPGHLLDSFQAVMKIVPCQKANTTHPLLRYIHEIRDVSEAKVMGKIIVQVRTEPYTIYTGKASQWPSSWFISCSSQSSLWMAAPWWRLWIGHCYTSCHSSSWPAPPDANVAQGMLGLGRTKQQCPLSPQCRCWKECWGLGWHRTCCQWH